MNCKLPNFYLNDLNSNPTNKIVMLCTATNRYEKKYINLIYSQYIYCRKCNFDYILITKSDVSHYWNILHKGYELLNKNKYDFLILIDADIFIKNNSPNIIFSLNNNKNSIFIAKGISNRPNSGLVILRNDEYSKVFLEKTFLLKNNNLILPENKAPGENGAVIQVLKYDFFSDKLFILDNIWNNTIKSRDCYFVHYTNYMTKYFNTDNKNIYENFKNDKLYILFRKIILRP